MGSNVFGTPITAEVLRTIPKYRDKQTITERDQALVALDMKNTAGKDVNARRFVEFLQTRFGRGNVCTMCLIYNATGSTATFVEAHDWKGRVCESPYPTIIANGQWGAFLHGQYYNSQDKVSRAGIVYSVVPNSGIEQHWFMGFSNSHDGLTNQNQVYTEIHDPGHYALSNTSIWNTLDSHLSRGRVVHLGNDIVRGGYLVASIGNTSVPVFEAIMTLPGIISRRT